MTIVETAKLDDVDPQVYLVDILDHKINRLDELLSWNWGPPDRAPFGGRLMTTVTHFRTIEYVANIPIQFKERGGDRRRIK